MSKATAVFDADDSRFGAALTRINGRMLALQSRIAKCAVAFVAIRAVARTVSAGFDQMRGAFELGGRLSDLSANTSVAVGDLVVLQQEFANAGKSAEEVGPVLAKMAKSLNASSASEQVAKLGLNLEELKRKSPAEQFRALGSAINGVTDPSQRAAISMQLFGRSGAELLALFASDGFGEAAKQLGSQAQLLARDANLFDDISDKLALTGVKVRGFWIGVAEKVAPVLKPLLDRCASLDLASWGQRAGEAVAFMVQAFADGKVGEMLFASAKIGLANAANFLAGALTAVAQTLWQILVEAVANAITLFQILTTADFWVGMGKALISIAQSFVALLLDGMARLLDSLSAVPLIGESIGSGAPAVRATAQSLRESSEDQRSSADDLLAPQLERASERMREAFANIGDAFTGGFERGSGTIDTSKWQRQLDGAVTSVMQRVQSVSDQSRKAVEAPKSDRAIDLDDEDDKQKTKPSVAVIQRIGGGVAAGDPMLREQQRQTRELATQTGLLRDVKRLLDRQPAKPSALTPAFG